LEAHDHVVTDASGNILGEQRYYPFGETRLTTGTIYTDKLFTGQREMAGLGIYHYQARFYSPKLGRFLSPDSLVPSYANPQHLNHFGYVTNNPLRYTDPSGNVPIDCLGGDGYCEGTPAPAPVSLTIPIPIPEPEFPTEPIPFIDLGPILIPPIPLPDLENPLCKMLRENMKTLEDQIISITDQIFSLLKELGNTTDPDQQRAIRKQIEDLNRQHKALLAQLRSLQEVYTTANCE
jgi:RHS repeat-associated protein